MQEVDAERRIQLLRGLQVDEKPDLIDEERSERVERFGPGRNLGRDRKRRRIEGEDDTERDLRHAKESQTLVPTSEEIQRKRLKTSNAPLTNRTGHINLFPEEGTRRNGPKNEEAEADAAKKKREFEDQYTMRFSNAAGFKESMGQTPWYQSTGNAGEKEATSKDVWGNEDPRRKEREKMRAAADDPLAMIQRGVQDLRKVERERKKWKVERERELRELADAERRREKRKRRRDMDQDDLEGFSLDRDDISDSSKKGDGYNGDGKSGRRHRHRSRSRERRHPHKHLKRREADVGWKIGPSGKYSSQFAEVQT